MLKRRGINVALTAMSLDERERVTDPLEALWAIRQEWRQEVFRSQSGNPTAR